MQLHCPKCKQPLHLKGKTYACENRHTFDQAKQGYVNLLLKQKASGDDEIMVQARHDFLHKGHYQPLATFLLDLMEAFPHDNIIDAGCGEGYYTNQIERGLLSQVMGFDVSKLALQKASRDNKQVNYAVASIFDMPVADACADIVLNVFAPIATTEFARVLHDEGYLIVVGPGVQHLQELKHVLYEEVRLNEITHIESDLFTLIDEFRLEYPIELTSQEEINNLFMMTPYYYKTSVEDGNKLKQCGT
ncbi:MAG: putative RNA methyltransferase, partial [Erysipelotrichaceae bacterium]